MANRKIYDCFCYFNEDMLLKIRMETLWDYVDYFVICESRKTISGKNKPLNFNPEKFHRYQSKIRYLVIDSYPFETTDAWKNERYQRDYLVNGIYDASPEDIIMISDVDEIPKPNIWDQFDPIKYKRADCQQWMYAYYLNNRWESKGEPIIWYGTKLTTYKHFASYFNSSMELLRNFKSKGLLRGMKRFWFKKFQTQHLNLAGWHFTWMAGVDAIVTKLESFAHQEFNKPEHKNKEHIIKIISSGGDVLFPDRHYVVQDLDEQFPVEILSNKDVYADYLLNRVG